MITNHLYVGKVEKMKRSTTNEIICFRIIEHKTGESIYLNKNDEIQDAMNTALIVKRSDFTVIDHLVDIAKQQTVVRNSMNEHWKLTTDLISFEPISYAGYSLADYSSGIESDVDAIGPLEIFENYLTKLWQAFQDYIKNKKHIYSFELPTASPCHCILTLWSFSAGQDYEGEWGSEHDFLGIIDESRLTDALFNSPSNQSVDV